MLSLFVLALGTIGLVVGAILVIGLAASIGVGILVPGFVIVAACTIGGLVASCIAIRVRRRSGRGIRFLVMGAAWCASVATLLAVGAVTVLVLLGEPSFDEAAQELTEMGLAVHKIGSDRPALLALPSGHDPASPLPLILNLHGYGSHYMAQDKYFGLSSLVNSHGFALVLANGIKDDKGKRAWNAADLCCGHAEQRPDDVTYLFRLVEEASELVNVDRVYSVGMSNGGWMSYRLACENLPELAGIVVLAGSSYSDPDRCASARPVSVLQIHGTEDAVVTIEGGEIPEVGEGVHPGARDLVQRWALRGGCDLAAAERLPERDVDRGIDGFETIVIQYSGGCRDGVAVEYWEMQGSPHVPSLVPAFAEHILAWLFKHGVEMSS